MVNILIKTESHYVINRKSIKDTVVSFLKEKSIKGEVEISISIVGNRLMKDLNSKYRNINDTTTLLSFSLMDPGRNKPFLESPDNVLRLGDIIISYPEARERALEDNMLMDKKINELIIHGLNNLMG